MTETLTSFSARRRKELDARERAIRAELAAIEAERRALAAAEIASGAVPIAQEEAVEKQRSIRKNSIMHRVLRVLSRFGRGLNHLEILSSINRDGGSIIGRSSLSPQLSRLKQSGMINLEKSTWSITQRGLDELDVLEK